MLQDFRQFIARGNVVDLAVAVMIGAAFSSIVSSLTDDIIMPVVGAIVGNIDFSNLFIRLGAIPEGYQGSVTNYAALKAAGVPMIGYGQFITALINFLIIAFVLFLVVRQVNRFYTTKKAEAEAPEVALLREIRDELRKP